MTEGPVTESQTSADASGDTRALGDCLCAVDGSPASFAAVEQATALVGPGGRLTLLEVTSFRSEGQYRSPAIGPAKAKRILDRAVAIAKDGNVTSTVEVDPASPPARVILDWSATHDLLAMGAPSSSWFAGALMASATDAAISQLATPLLIARSIPEGEDFASRILVASDGLDGSDQLVEFAGQLARPRRARVILLHATHHAAGARSRRVDAQARNLQVAVGDASEVRFERGRARSVIVDAARDVEANLIVMSSRRLRGLRAIGSVSRHVMHEALCSVMLVPPEHLQA